jgi:uncharacterized protein YjbI with pentapeptide repeats
MSSFNKPMLKKLKLSRNQVGYLGAIAGFTVFVIYCAVSSPEQIAWTGFKQDTEISKTEKVSKDGKEIATTTKYVSGKTLWDWLGVLGIPLALAVLGLLQQRRAEKQAALEKEIAESNQKEEVLQAYFDRLAALLIDKNLITIAARNEMPSERTIENQELLSASRDIIRARTLSILRRLEGDGQRKGSVIQFLADAEVISKLKLDLKCADLMGIVLSGADLRDVNLSGADLSGANFSEAILRGANLNGSDLRIANLNGSDLSGANLSGANLSNANLSDANLSSANLSDANLHGVNLVIANLSGANLSGAYLSGADLRVANLNSANFINIHHGLAAEQVAQARLCNTKLPSYIQLDPNRDC